MKKLLLLNFLMIISLISFAQNTNFEYWDTDTILYLDNYQSTVNENPVYGPMAVSRSNDFVDGAHSLKLQTVLSPENDTIFGYFLNGDPETFAGGQPTILSAIDSVVGYYKYDIASGDTALFLCIPKYLGTPTGGGVFPITGTQSTWTRFAYPISASSVDSIIIAAASSNAINEIGITPGSWVMFDNVQLKSNAVGMEQINNYSFENWTNYTWDDLSEWITPNKYFVGAPQMPVEKTTDAYSGNYAALLKTFVSQWGDTISGFASYGMWTQNGPVGGFEFSSNIDSVEFYFKSAISGSDTASVIILFKNSGNIVGQNGVVITQNNLTYTKWSQAVNLVQPSDTVFIAMSSGKNPGTQLIVDKINFIFPVIANENYNIQEIVAYPNPTYDNLHFRINSNINNDDINVEIYDISGKLLMSEQYSNNNEIIINTSDLKSGYYFYKLNVGDKTFRKPFVKK